MAITNGEIASYRINTPSTWNFSPKDETGMVVPAEESLIGANADPVNPVEPGRIIRSFDPCLSCATHFIDWEGKTLYSSIRPRFNRCIFTATRPSLTFGISGGRGVG
jgi:Ni,Fe-hydrogenase I large subunit